MGPDLILILAGIFGFYMAFNIGANDVANAMGTSVGSKSFTLKQAIIAAAIFEFLGAFLVGGEVTQTIKKGLLDLSLVTGDHALEHFQYGMLAALLSAALWLQVATHFGLPVSTTHSIVGAVWGFGLAYGGTEIVEWGVMGKVVTSWFVSPLAGLGIAFIIFKLIDDKIFNVASPARATRRWAPVFIFFVFVVLVLSLIYKGLKNLNLNLPFVDALTISLLVGLAIAVVASLLIRRVLKPHYPDARSELDAVERVFKYLQILTACYIAFAHGSNDVANAIGPLAAVVHAVQEQAIPLKSVGVHVWMLALGGVGIIIGVAVLGYKVIATVGSRITEMTPSRGFTACLAAATTVLICSKMGLPISTTHTLVGAVIGVALARGIAALDRRVIRGIVASWFVTVPVAGIFSVTIYKVFVAAFI